MAPLVVADADAMVRGSGDAHQTWLNWIVRTRDDGAEIGYVQATVTGEVAEVAWLIEPAHQGRGLAAEAATAMSDWLVANGVPRIRAHIHPDHVASQMVAERIGLVVTDEVDDEGEVVWASPT